MKVKECLDNNLPVILQISFDQYETQWIVVVGYAKDKDDKVSYLLTLDSRKDLRIGCFWNGILNLDRCITLKYGFQYITDVVELVGLDDAIIRESVCEFDTEQYQYKMKIVDFLKSRGVDYKSAPIPDYIIQEIQKKHPDNWQDYLKRY